MQTLTKRILALLLVCVLALGAAPAALASDEALTRGEVRDLLLAAADDYSEAEAGDVLTGGREDETATRAEVLVMLARAFGEPPEPVGDSARWAADLSGMTDIPGWAKTELGDMLSAGLVTGNAEGLLAPGESVSRAELDTLLARIYALEASNLKDDFYAVVNKEWLETAEIPAGSAMTGTLSQLMNDTDKRVAELIAEIAAGTPEKGSAEEKIKNLYDNILDWDARNEAGIEPIKPWLDAIEKAATLDELMAVSNELLSYAGVGLAFFGPNQSVEDSSKKVLAFGTLAPSLSRDLYAMDGVQGIFSTYVSTLFLLGGDDELTALENTKTYVEMDKALAEVRMSQEDMADFTKIFNFMDAKDLKALFPNVDLEAVLAAQGLHDEDRYVVSDVELTKKAAEYFTEEHLEDLKLYLRLSILSNFGELLNREFTDASEAYSAALQGIEGSLTDEENAAQAVQQYLSDYLGRVYIEKYFSAEAKAEKVSVSAKVSQSGSGKAPKKTK